MENQPIRIKKIFKRKIASQLSVNGHKLIATEPNKYKPNFSVYLFEETVELLNDLTKLTINNTYK